jgi:non-ribosomal peptide synthetase component F/aryl carrier-like protein
LLVWLQDTLAELLHADSVNADDDYFGIGGNSIIALQLLDHVQRQHRVHLKLVDIYDHPVVGDLAAALSARLVREPAPPATPAPTSPAEPEPVPADDGHPLPPIRPGAPPVLSYGQERMWFHHQLDPGTTLYNLPGVSRHRGPLDVDALRLAWEDLAGRHEVLRSNFVESDGRPRLVVRPELGDFFRYEDVSGAPDPVAAAQATARNVTHRVLDLARDPLVQVTVIRCAPDDHLMCWVMHHAVNDGWAPQIQRKELLEFYAARTEGRVHRPTPLPVQYRDYARWQQELAETSLLDGELDYWRERLSDPPALDLPTDRPRPARMDFAGASYGFTLPADLVKRLRAVGGQETATLFMVLLTGLKALLSRHSGQRDIVIGTPTIGRGRPELWGLLGFFNNTVALRSDLSGAPTFRELLRRERGVVLGALDHQETPFDKIVREVAPHRDPGRNPIFDVMYVHQTLPPGVDFGDQLFRPDGDDSTGPYFPGLPPGTAKFDLTVVVAERAGEDSLDVVVEYATALFDAGTVANLADSLLELLEAVATDPDLRYEDLVVSPLVTPPAARDEDTRALAHWRTALAGLHAFEPPADRSRPVAPGTSHTARHMLPLPEDLALALERSDACERMLAALAALLCLHAERDEVVIGLDEAPGGGTSRPPLPLRLGLADDPSYDDLTERVRAQIAAAGDGPGVPLAALERDLGLSREPGRPPLVDVTYAHGRAPAGWTGPSGHDLAWSLVEGSAPGELSLSVEYRTALFDAATVAALADDLVAVVRAALREPGVPVPALWLAAAVPHSH